MGRLTKIDWCDATWNPVTGCLHGCEYCYARRIAERFGSKLRQIFVDYPVLDKPIRCSDTYGYMRDADIHGGKIVPYPFDFLPTFHKYRLDEPQRWKKPRTIFVCSMADLFGDWVPDEWIKEVFETCEKAPQHRYLFLTKNPTRYSELIKKGIVMPNFIDWHFGYTMDGISVPSGNVPIGMRSFVSIEPIQKRMTPKEINMAMRTNWVIIGAETGNRKNKVVPEREWIDEIVAEAQLTYTPVFMKESLRSIMGNDFRQEFPWEV